MKTKDYSYKSKTTEDLIQILEWGIDMACFEPSQRYYHVEAAAWQLSERKDDPAAIEAVCSAPKHVGAFHVNRIEGVYDDSESRLQVIIAGRFLRDHDCVRTTRALLHAAASGQSEHIRHHATKSLVRRPIKVLEQAMQEFMQDVQDELQASVRQHFLERFAPPTAG